MVLMRLLLSRRLSATEQTRSRTEAYLRTCRSAPLKNFEIPEHARGRKITLGLPSYGESPSRDLTCIVQAPGIHICIRGRETFAEILLLCQFFGRLDEINVINVQCFIRRRNN